MIDTLDTPTRQYGGERENPYGEQSRGSATDARSSMTFIAADFGSTAAIRAKEAAV